MSEQELENTVQLLTEKVERLENTAKEILAIVKMLSDETSPVIITDGASIIIDGVIVKQPYLSIETNANISGTGPYYVNKKPLEKLTDCDTKDHLPGGSWSLKIPLVKDGPILIEHRNGRLTITPNTAAVTAGARNLTINIEPTFVTTFDPDGKGAHNIAHRHLKGLSLNFK